ncbi:MAG TPA: 50S ribosomal protein L4, partial [Acidothermaceae bacterium]|nr:50S ribosomal protein L4 [Acidothermaceae bacterium]
MSVATDLEPVIVERRNVAGEVLGTVALDPAYFSLGPNGPLLHQVITAQLANRRAGTQSTKTRSEVKGGSKKPYRQKGTGNARQGTIRAPHYAGGGVALGPKPRSYAQRTPKKMVQLALKCALSDRAREGGVCIVDRFNFEVPRTKHAIAALDGLGAEGRVLVVLARSDANALKSFSNLGYVATLPADQLTAYDVLSADVVVFTDETLPGEASPSTAPATAPRRRATELAAIRDEVIAATFEGSALSEGDDDLATEEATE